MVEISVRHDFQRFERSVDAIRAQHLPFATARALTDTAQDARQAITAALPSIFDRPTSFTLNGIGVRQATKSNLAAVVFLKDLQAAYLLHEEIGGTRTAAENTRKPATALVLPGAAKLDAHGNIQAGLLARLRRQAETHAARRAKRADDRKHVASGKPPRAIGRDTGVAYLPAGNRRGVGGYFRRLDGHHLQRLTAFEPSAAYKPRFHFRDRVAQTAAKTFRVHLMRRLREALTS